MSEQPKKLEDLLTEMNNRLKELAAASKSAPSQSTGSPTPSKHEHQHSANVQFDCPDCQKAYDADVKAKALNAEREKRKQFKDVEFCEDCGEVYDGEETEECPTCHPRADE